MDEKIRIHLVEYEIGAMASVIVSNNSIGEVNRQDYKI
jgi:hypothetical protein